MLILLYALVFFTIFFRTAAGDSPLLEFGSCSTKCQISLSDTSASGIFPPHQCSCSQSCAIYGDCCYDSPYRTEVKKPRKISCLQVHGSGSFQAVSTCPSEMNEMEFGCTSGIGHLPPVTSKSSGLTYANIFCAFCNEDYNLHYWNVEQRCKEENESRSIDQHQNPGSMVTSQTQQHCEYYAHNDDFTFLDNLELRSCSSTDEIFRCSPSWRNYSVSQLCHSYSDPVYINNKLYKNLHCAECNYEILTSAKCQPAIVETLLAAGMNATEIYQLCKEGNFIDCLNYIHDSGRGKPLPFRYLFKINEKMCIPKPGKLCCEGERFDPRSETCRKVIHSFRRG
ncbi:uncharacterized protein LOC118179330 [Stegodyphus dumicola]|uniref:uncharacterized protein LOC118179330 n=1 Tax=Stegodyphus dumicola TaxID=202533 RepID=UPI0015A91AB4|nr:uncharacterized protein LOC118179330 [Stegodyphus dumicola]